MSDNIEQLSAYRTPEENVEVEARLSAKVGENDPQTTLDVYHTPEGEMFAEGKDGQQFRVDYVDTGALIAGHESKMKDEEVAAAGIANEHLEAGDTEAAEAIAEMQLEKSKEQSEPVDVFARVFRKITNEFGRESVLSVKTTPDWSVSDGNAGEVSDAIATNMAYMIPESMKDRVLQIVREASNFGTINSDERAVDNFFTGNPREGSNYIGIPLKSQEKNTVFMYFLFGKSTAEKEQEGAVEREKQENQDSSTVDSAAA